MAPAAARRGRRRPRARRRQPARQRGLAAAVAGAAADRRADRPAGRLHPADRPDQLLRPAPARPARVGVGDDAGSSSCVFAVGRLRLRRARCAAATSSSTRSRIVRGAPGATDGTAQVYVGVFSPSRGTLPGQRPGRRAPVVADQRRLLRRRRHGGRARRRCRAIRPGSATSRSGSGRCGRSGPRPPVAVPLIETDLASRTAASRARSRTRRRSRLERPAVVLGGTVAVAEGPRARAPSRPSTSRSQHDPVRPAAVGQGRRPDLLRRHGQLDAPT